MSRPPLPDSHELSSQGVIAVVGAAVIVDGRCFVARRGLGGSSGGRWEFPGGKVEAGESPEAALIREMNEEFSVHISVDLWVARGESWPDNRQIVLDVYRCRLVSGQLTGPGPDHEEVLWANPTQLRSLDWARADVPIVPFVEKLLTEDS